MILCLGTTPTVQRVMTFARVQWDAVNRATDVKEAASGKSINVARVLTTLGEEALATGFLGGDTGKFIREDLNRARIAHEFVGVGPKTRTCITVIDQSNGSATEMVEESKPLEPEAWEWMRARMQSLLVGAKLIVMSGSLPPGAPVDFYAWCVRQANLVGAAAIVDASCEPLRLALAERPMLVKPNRMELARTFEVPTETDGQLRDGLRTLVERGAKWALVTLGAEGLMISDGQKIWKLTAPKVQVVSAIGSGDSLAAGLAAGIAGGQDMIEACRLGVACATANAETATPGVLEKERVEQLRAEIRVQERA